MGLNFKMNKYTTSNTTSIACSAGEKTTLKNWNQISSNFTET